MHPDEIWRVSVDLGSAIAHQKRWVFLFVRLAVCLFVTLLNVRDCAPDFAVKALEYRNDSDTVG